MNTAFTINNPMPPVWLMYPQISQFSIGWRMGYGEQYRYDLGDWLDTLSEEEQATYHQMFPRPSFWHDVEDIDDMDEYYYNVISFWRKNGETKYSRSKLVDHPGLASPGYVFFWKPSSGVVDKSCMGQWQPSRFDVDADEYKFAEQYMMAEKARLFEDKDVEEKIMQSSDPKEMKALGKKVRNFDQFTWDKVKYSIVLNCNYYKFTQDEAMRNFLLSTGDKVLVEASPLDTIWGIGLSEDNVKALNAATWRGQNLLGFALMEVRDELRALYKNYDAIDWENVKKIYWPNPAK